MRVTHALVLCVALGLHPTGFVRPCVAGARDTQTPTRIRVSGKIQQTKLINKVPVNYPPEAKAARIQGVVQLQIVIGTDGTVKQAEVLSGQPLLVRAALDAVRQWTYAPTTLNGQPVEVVTRVAVVFHLK